MSDPAPAPYFRSAAFPLDVLLFALAAIALGEGVDWGGRRILRHAADLRRAGIALALLAAWALPAVRARSLWLRGAASAWQALHRPRARRLALAAGCVVMVAIAVLQALALRVPLYDVGIFHQIVWAIARGHGFASTISGAGNFLLDHFAPTLAFLSPLFRLADGIGAESLSPLILPVVQPLLLATGVAAWVWAAERLDERAGMGGALAAAATVFGLCFDSLWGNLHWGFHENALAFASLSWAYALLLTGAAEGAGDPSRGPWRRLGVLALLLFGALSKEILLVDVAFALGVWAWQGRRRRGESLALFLTALALLAGFVAFEKMHHPADKNYFDRYYSYLGHDLGAFARTLALSPWVVVQKIGAGELLRYAGMVLVPWLGLPLYALMRDPRRGAWALALLPSLASAALSTDGSLRRGNFHYPLELWPVLAAISLTQLAGLRSRRLALGWALAAFFVWDHDPWGMLREFSRGARESAAARQALLAIPPQDSVAADELAGTWVAGRLEVTRWPALPPAAGEACPRWVVLRGDSETARLRARCGQRHSLVAGAGDLGPWRIFRGD